MQLKEFNLKKAESKKKQPLQLSNFSPLSSMTSWAWWKSIRIIIQSDYFAAFNTPVATFSWFLTCCVHKIKFKRLITYFNSFYITLKHRTIIETLLRTLFSRTNFNSFFNRCCRSSCSFFFWDKSACACVPNSC